MKRRMTRACLSLALAFLMLAPLALPAALAADSDIGSHWAEETLAEWIDLGLLGGYGDGTYRPNNSITRAEFAKLVNGLKQYTDASGDISAYTDVPAAAWYARDIAVAVTAGYLNGTGAAAMSPDRPLTREQAITIVSRIQRLDTPDIDILSQASDGGTVADWAQTPVAAAIRAGFVTGHNGRLNPKASITRAETVVLLDRIRTGSRIYGFAGTYGPEEGTEVIDGDLTIAVPGVNLRNLSVAKDLTVAAGVGEGAAGLSHVAVGGRIYVARGQNALSLADVRAQGDLIVRKSEGENTVRIVVSGDSGFGAVRLQSGATLVTQNLAAGTALSAEIAADAPASSAFAFDGTFDSITNNAKDAPIAVTGAVGKLTLNASAQVSGAGRITTAEVRAGAGQGTTFETAPAGLTGDGKGDVTLPTPPVSSGSSGGGGNTPSTPVTHTVTFLANGYTGVTGLPGALTVTQGAAATRPADPALAGQSFVDWYLDAAFTAPYDWAAPVTANLTLYARFEDTLTAAALALDFAAIRGANTHEQGILTDLALPATLPNYPGVSVSWNSRPSGIISATGTVTRPDDNEADAEVTLTATLTLDSEPVTKNFDLIVRKQGIAGVSLKDVDPRFAPGYPKLVFDEVNGATLKVKLNPGVASEEHPVIAYFVMDEWGDDNDKLDKESILYGHKVSVYGVMDDVYESVSQSSVFGEFYLVNDDEEEVYPYKGFWIDGCTINVGVVLLADDALDDPDAVATVISVATEGIDGEYVDTVPPDAAGSSFNVAGNKIYAYFDERVSNTDSNLPPASNFEISGLSDVTVTGVAVDHDFDLTESDRWASWLILTLSRSVLPGEQTDDIVLTYTPDSGASAIRDTNDNLVTDTITWRNITPGTQTVSAYVRPAEGLVTVSFAPAIYMTEDNYQALRDGVVQLLYQGVSVTDLQWLDSRWLIGQCDLLFEFAPISGDTFSAEDFTVTIGSGLTSTAFEPMAPTSLPSSVLSFSDIGEALSFCTTVEEDLLLVVALPAGIHLDGFFGNVHVSACNFVLTADGKRILLRGFTHGFPADDPEWTSFLLFYINDRVNNLLLQATEVTLEYDPDASGHNDPANRLIDRTDILVPDFGPIHVDMFP